MRYAAAREESPVNAMPAQFQSVMRPCLGCGVDVDRPLYVAPRCGDCERGRRFAIWSQNAWRTIMDRILSRELGQGDQ